MRPILPRAAKLCTSELLRLRLAAPRKTDALKRSTANMLSQLDRFEEALDEYQSMGAASYDWAATIQIAAMHRAIGGKSHTNQAEALYKTALQKCGDDDGRVLLSTELGDIYRKAGDLTKAAEYFRDALKIEPGNSKALRKLAVTSFDQGEIDELLEFCEQLIAGGICHTRLHATYFGVLAKLGRVDEAEQIRGLDRYFWQGGIDTPDGFETTEAFNAALAGEIREHPALRFENSQQASEHSWRVDELMIRSQPAVTLLLEQVAGEVENYARRLADTENTAQSQRFFRSLMPNGAKIFPWSIITREQGHENWHTHDKGWLSGVYYAAVPTGLPAAKGKAGAIEFGWPERLLGEGSSEKYGNKVIRPEPGMLLLFPSHTHHRTYPHGLSGERIVVSFDIIPTA